jgi:hypothetical protein
MVVLGTDVGVVIAVWLDPPQPARTIVAAAIAAFFPCIEKRVSTAVLF